MEEELVSSTELVDSMEKQLQETRMETFERARKFEISMDLFPSEQPWVNFPWEKEFRPRSACEDQLRQAIGLRDLTQLDLTQDIYSVSWSSSSYSTMNEF